MMGLNDIDLSEDIDLWIKKIKFDNIILNTINKVTCIFKILNDCFSLYFRILRFNPENN